MHRWLAVFLVVYIYLSLLLPAHAQTPTPTPVPQYGVLELTYNHSTVGLTNNWEYNAGTSSNPDIHPYLTATFHAPAGNQYLVEGFYYDTDTYKVRFTPAETGTYSYTITPYLPGWPTVSNTFTVITSTNHGFVIPNTNDSNHFQTADGTFFNGIGLNDCWGSANPDSGFIDAGTSVNLDTYFSTYGNAGFNLFRWNPGNCSYNIWNGSTYQTTGNVYLLQEGKAGDLLLQTAKQHGFHTLFDFWWIPPNTTQLTPPISRAISYVIARYGAYIDLWEISNEQYNSSFPTNILQSYIQYLRIHDPYPRLVTNSYPYDQDWTYLDFRSPHEPLQNAWTLRNTYTNYNHTNKRILVGETYNQGMNSNWTTSTDNQMRMAHWTGFISGLEYIYWNTSYCKGCSSPNMYLGSAERQVVKSVQDFTTTFGNGLIGQLTSSALTIQNDTNTLGYLLKSSNKLVGYLYHTDTYLASNPTSRTSTVSGINLPFAGTLSWFDPRNHNVVLQTTNVSGGTQNLTSPAYPGDIVFTVISGTPPPLSGDLNSDNHVDYRDFLILISQFNQPSFNIFTLNSVIKNFSQ